MEIKFLLYLQQIKMQTKMRSGSRYLWLLSSCWSSALNLQQQLDLISVIGGDEEDRRERESCERERERERERKRARERSEDARRALVWRDALPELDGGNQLIHNRS